MTAAADGTGAMAGVRKTRVLIFVVAYNAERTIEKVVARIPQSLLQYVCAGATGAEDRGRRFSRHDSL
jgi:hypothetical protein